MVYSFGQRNFSHINDNDVRNHLISFHLLRTSMLLLSAVLSPSFSADAFATPPRITAGQCLSPLHLQRQQADVKFDGRTQTTSFVSEVNGNVKRRRILSGKRLPEKIKSTSNSYLQYYKEGVLVGIERTSTNSRRISGEIIMDLPISAIWDILTDYDNLSVHVPNLVNSRVINIASVASGERPRVYQRGAQRIFGFEFGADVTLDMTENMHHPHCYSVDFECVASQFFSEFDGSWILEEYSNARTMVRYIVDVRPNGPVPVAALEWRIKEDVPINILAVSKSAQAMNSKASRFPAEQEQTILLSASQRTQQQLQESLPQETITYPQQQRMRQADATFNLIKRTAKAFLPTPIITVAKQAMEVIYNPSSLAMAGSRGIRRVRTSTTISAKSETHHSFTALGQSKINGVGNADSDWYLDETMAIYLDEK